MANDTPFEELLAALYEGPLEEAPWASFMARLRERLRADLVTLLLRPPSLDEQVVMLSDGGSLSAIESYNAGQFVLDPFVDLPQGEVLCLQEYLPGEALLDSDFYRVIMAPQGWHDFIGSDLRGDGDLDVRLRAGRYVGGRSFGAAEKRLLRRLLPHLERSVRLYQRISRSERERAVYAGAVEQLQVATVILDERGAALSANTAAQQLLDRGDALTLRDGRLHLCQREADDEFQELLQSVRLARSATPFAVQAMQAPGSEAGGLGLVLRSVAPSGAVEGKGMPRVAVFISDPAQAVEPQKQAIARLFGLTPAEAGLSLLLASGMTLDEAAESLAVSRNTARAHLRSVFAKTGVSRQSGLVRLILSSVAPLATGPSVSAP